MQIKINFNYVVDYYPTKLCRKIRKMVKEDSALFNIQEASVDDAPVAFWITTFGFAYPETPYAPVIDTEDKEFWRNGKDGVKEIPEYNRWLTYPIRYYKGRFYKEYVNEITHYLNPEASSYEWKEFQFVSKNDTSVIEKLPVYLTDVTNDFAIFCELEKVDRPYNPETSIIKDNERDKRIKKIQSAYDSYLFIDGRLYCECSEPRYEVNTFGLGHNHGGTDYCVQYAYNTNIAHNNYFRADQYYQMMEYAINTALSRGDTESVKEILDQGTYIQVIRPDLIKLNPKKEAGDGNPLTNELDGIIRSSDDSMQAGLIIAMRTLGDGQSTK